MAKTSPMTAAEIRQSFLDFFQEKQHTIVSSASLMPDAPNLLFTNAGMNQFVPIFLGNAPCPYDPARAADTQKCIRAGGKHNDLEDVGYDTYHQTFFEMLGNWSFGDYFKQDAITWAWELVTKRWGFPAERLYATVYQPGEGDPAETDNEAYKFWSEIFTAAGLDPKVHIVYGGKKDNFWMMGDTGPCGPCSELHVNLLPEAELDPPANRTLVNADDPRIIEIWNLVFIQFNSDGAGNYPPLPAQHVDTGMGFERVTSIIQGTKGFTDFSTVDKISNYNTDLFRPLFDELEKQTGKTYASTLPAPGATPTEQEKVDIAFRVIADHVRCLAFAIGDGIMPSNLGRGYVLRRILRRAVMSVYDLGIKEPFLCQMVDVLAKEMGGMFPELKEKRTFIEATIRSEEESFLRTVDAGKQRFVELCGHMVMEGGGSATPTVLVSGAKKDGEDRRPRRSIEASSSQSVTSEQVRYWRRKLPHFERPWAKYHLTFSTKDRAELSPSDRDTVMQAILHSKGVRYELYAACVMPDHVHLLLEPLPKNRDEKDSPEFWSLSKIIGDIKSVSAHQINQTQGSSGSIWEREYHDRMIRSEADLQEKYEYVLNNPWKDGVFEREGSYGWVWCPEKEWTTAGETPAETAGDGGPPPQKQLFPAEEAFRLYDTYGFPLDLTQRMARERGLEVDVPGFEKLMGEQRERAKAAQKKTVITVDSGSFDAEATEFVGYDNLDASGKVEAVQNGVLVVERTPFYAEMGGQVGDTGEVEINGQLHKIVNTQKSPEGTFLHQLAQGADLGEVEGAEASLSVSRPRRARIEAHHSVTHIMHWALREVLGDQVTQKGSYVGPDRLRFDFSHGQAMKPEEITKVEELVNAHIAKNEPVRWEERPYADVQKDPSVLQFFGDKYGEVVRVVTIGDGYSTELCGGTHVTHTNKIGFFKLLSEGAIAAGIRRVEAATGAGLVDYVRGELDGQNEKHATLLHKQSELPALHTMGDLDNDTPEDIWRDFARRADQLVELDAKVREFEKQAAKDLAAVAQKQAAEEATQLLPEVRNLNGVPLLTKHYRNQSPKFLQALADALKTQFQGVGVFVLTDAKKAMLIAIVGQEHQKTVKAGDIIKQIAPLVGGKGGGKPDRAQGGGGNPAGADEALAAVESMLE